MTYNITQCTISQAVDKSSWSCMGIINYTISHYVIESTNNKKDKQK